MSNWRRVRRKMWFGALCLQLVALLFLPFIDLAEAAANHEDGFIIQADRVVGEDMKAMVVTKKNRDGKTQPMLRFTYSAVHIYGMKLTKHLRTSSGTVSITMKANGPVHMKGMVLDASAISFKGACVHAIKLVPEATLKDVTMVAHYMNSDSSRIEHLKLNTVNGEGDAQKPGTLKILQDLASLPYEQMQAEINKITEGQLPLTCTEEESSNAELIDDSELGTMVTAPISAPVKETLEKVTDPLNGVLGKEKNTLNSTVKQVGDALKKPIETATEKLKNTVNKVNETVSEGTKPLNPIVEKVKDTTADKGKDVTNTVDSAKQVIDKKVLNACERLSAANGKLTKEIALELVNEAIDEHKKFEELCVPDENLTNLLKEWKNEYVESRGLLSVLGLMSSEEELLTEIREEILKEEDGSVLSFE